MTDAKKNYLLVKGDQNKISLVNNKDQGYLDYLRLEPIELTQQDFWSIIGEYIDGSANIVKINGRLGKRKLNKFGVSLSAEEIIKFAGMIDHISSVVLTLKQIDNNALTIKQSGLLTVDYRFSEGISPYMDDIVQSIPPLIQNNYETQEAHYYKWNA